MILSSFPSLRSGLIAVQSKMAVQLPTLNSRFLDVNGTLGSIRNALELSMTNAPAARASGTNAFDRDAPAEKKATSTPANAPSLASLISRDEPAKSKCFPTDRSLAKRVRELIGNFRCSNNRKNSPPTAPVAPTIATLNDSRTPNVLPQIMVQPLSHPKQGQGQLL